MKVHFEIDCPVEECEQPTLVIAEATDDDIDITRFPGCLHYEIPHQQMREEAADRLHEKLIGLRDAAVDHRVHAHMEGG